jgi:hypothetical protein
MSEENLVVQEEVMEQETINPLTLYENSSKTFLANVKKANLLTPELTEKITALSPELNHVFKTQTIWRSETEIRVSVLNDMNFPDKASKYHQAKIEQLVFFEQLLHLSFDYRQLQQDLAILEAEAEEIEYKLENEELKSFEVKKLEAQLAKKNIEIEQKTFGIQHYQIQARERIREIDIWSKIKDELDDGSFDKDNKDSNQLISLARRYIQEAWNAVNLNKNSDICSFNNITAQFHMMVKECITRGLFETLMQPFGGPGNPIFDWVCSQFGIQIKPVMPDGNMPSWNPQVVK